MTRLIAILIAAAALLLTAGLGFYFWRHDRVPPIPELALDEVDPEFRAAIEQAQGQIRATPKSADAWGQLGKILRAGGNREPAAACFGEAARLDPDNPRWPYLRGEALLWSDSQSAIESLRQAVARCARSHVEEFAPRLRLAEALLANGQADKAEEQLQRVLEADPEQPVAHLLLGRAAYARDDLERSRSEWNRCLDHPNPFTQQQANNHLAELSGRAGDGPAAEKYQQRANALRPDINWPDPWLDECLRQAVGAVALFRRAEQLEAQGRIAEAIQILREICARAPNYKAYVGLGKFLPSLGDLPGAEKALRQALELDPKGLQAHYYLGRVLWAEAEQKRKAGVEKEATALLEESVEQFRLTIELKADYGLAHLSKGIALKDLHRNREAAESLREAIIIMPELPDSYLHLAELLAAEGKTQEARRVLEQGLPLSKPEDTRIQQALAKLKS